MNGSATTYRIVDGGSSRKMGCCRRLKDDDYNAEMLGSLSDRDVVESLKIAQVQVLVVVVVQWAFLLLWALAAIVPGFALYDGAPTTYSAYTHLGWWLIVELVAAGFGTAATLFGLNYVNESGVLERGAERTVSWLGAYMIILGAAAFSGLIHAGFSLSELAVCDSTLCTQNRWMLIILVVVLFLMAALLLINIYFVWEFRDRLKLAMAFERYDMKLSSTNRAIQQQPASAPIGKSAHAPAPAVVRRSTTAPSASAAQNGGAGAGAAAKTPMLRAAAARNNGARHGFIQAK